MQFFNISINIKLMQFIWEAPGNSKVYYREYNVLIYDSHIS